METSLFEFSTDVSSENLTEKPEVVIPEQLKELSKIDVLDFKLSQHFNDKFIVQPALTRQLVSFQANKTMASYRWYKYKEAFSAPLVEYLLSRYRIESGKVLDPFAGSGTTMFAASAIGMEVDGIELLTSRPNDQWYKSNKVDFTHGDELVFRRIGSNGKENPRTDAES